jgi:hypothetical protein
MFISGMCRVTFVTQRTALPAIGESFTERILMSLK